MPQNMPQERYYNFSIFYLAHGDTFIRQIVEEADPFMHKHIVLQPQTISI
jgi:hypothetical protein